MKRRVNLLDASRMTATTSGETTRRVSTYFGEGGPFSYQKVRKLTPALLSATLPYEVITAGLEKIKLDVARNSNTKVAELLWECTRFRGRHFYPLDEVSYAVDREFNISLKPETVCAVDGLPNLIFLQPRKYPTLWPYNPAFMRRVLEDAYIPDYYENARFWLVDTEAREGGDRHMTLVDLQSVAPMNDREFIRRMASLRAAWRLYLRTPRPKKDRPTKPDDRQSDFGFE
ncbi:hypothetical protein [Sphingomonas sp.]|uniref:hypothetical protein n=1 Tax=Sphingomonas sp. TaxID=28214 RepID=UPI0035BBD084